MIEDRIKGLFAEARQAELIVLIWGPGDPGSDPSHPSYPYWNKRCQIREEIRKAFPNAGVYFSEDDQLRQFTRHLEDVLAEEWVHASQADCILVLDVSRGAHVEVDRFSRDPILAAKMRLLLPVRYVGTTSLVSMLHHRLRVIGFSDEEFDLCSLATKKCVDIILTVAVSKLLALRNGGYYV